MQCDPTLPQSNSEEEEDAECDNESMPRLFTRNDDDSSDDDDDSSDDESIINDDTTVSVNEFDDDINVIIKDLNGVQFHFHVYSSLSVHLAKEHYFNLDGLDVEKQRVFFNGKVISDEDSMHSYGVVDRSLIHLVRTLRRELGQRNHLFFL